MNWWGIVVSFAFVFAFIGAAQLLLRAGRISASVTRKIVHIGVAHWWLLAMVFFDRWEFAIVGPVAFIFINLASYLFGLFPAMEHEKRSRNLGTVYFPISLLICMLLTWAGPIPIWMGGLAILVLGWGDGLASLVGEQRARGTFRVFGNTKSVAGTATMFAASLAVTVVFTIVFGGPVTLTTLAGSAILTALVATTVEVVTPFGLDNLTVPLSTLLFYTVL
ncbi:MAG: diacylglycerol/polyprenol kinase family protein [Spirochaetota bacterium]